MRNLSLAMPSRFRTGLLVLGLCLPLLAMAGCSKTQSPVKAKPVVKKTVERVEPAYTLETHDSYQVRVYRTPWPVHAITRDDWKAKHSPEEGYQGYYSASHQLDTDWMVEAYAPEDRQTVLRLIADDQALMSQAREMHQVAQEQVLERIDYQEYAILKIERLLKTGESLQRFVPLKQTKTGWLLTDDLDQDPFYQQLALKQSILPVLELPDSEQL